MIVDATRTDLGASTRELSVAASGIVSAPYVQFLNGAMLEAIVTEPQLQTNEVNYAR